MTMESDGLLHADTISDARTVQSNRLIVCYDGANGDTWPHKRLLGNPTSSSLAQGANQQSRGAHIMQP